MPGEYSLNCFKDWSRRGKLNARKHSKLSFSSGLNRYLHLQILLLFLFHDTLLYCSEEQENHVRTSKLSHQDMNIQMHAVYLDHHQLTSKCLPRWLLAHSVWCPLTRASRCYQRNVQLSKVKAKIRKRRSNDHSEELKCFSLA